ncbi:MAG: hypothetical protein PHV82_16915 [Victivallaceae bacterium]|nr:hypothetical protein [Victivallaceae bacterium]
MIFKRKKQFIRHQYTIIELLVVLVIAGILTGLTIGGIKGAIARQGATGAVRTLATKISLAQSFAVSRNRYVALLMPDDNHLNSDLGGCTYSSSGTNVPIPANNTDNFDSTYFFTQNRLCFVDRNSSGEYVFNSWVEGYEWQKLPSKTVAFIVSETGTSAPEKSNSAKVSDVGGTSGKDCSAVIFKPSGALVDASQVIVRVYRAAYVPATTTANFIWQGTETPAKGWKIAVNGYTGRSRYYQGGESIADE